MKRIFLTAAYFSIAYLSSAQTLNSSTPSNLNVPASAQPVPSSNTTERGAPTATPLIPPPANPVPPIYPGGEARVAETQPNLIYPAAPPAPTQPVQREPLTPIESNNTLNPTRPQRDEASRVNPGVQVQTETRMTSPQQATGNTSNRNTNRTTTATQATANGAGRLGANTAPSPAAGTSASGTVSSRDKIAMQADGTGSTRTTTTTTKKITSSSRPAPSRTTKTKTVRGNP